MKITKIIFSTLLIGLMFQWSFAAEPAAKEGQAGLGKEATLEFVQYDANQIRAWIGNNGHIVSHVPTGSSGLEWPKFSTLTAVFASGLWVAGIVDGEIRSAAAEFSTEYQPGVILYDPITGTSSGPDNPNDVRFQVSSIDKGDGSNPDDPTTYNREYATWPSGDGAPAHDGEYFEDANANGVWDEGESYTDFDNDGVYDGPDGMFVSGEDPALITGDQMHWFVINDADENVHANLWSTRPLGVEVQTTIFGFNRSDPLGNIMFVKWLVINKSGGPIEDMYLSIWSDADVGDANDDYVGCDTSLSVGYFYNGEADDQDYGLRVPAVGYDFFQGPIVPSVGDTALISGRKIADFQNLPMTSFVMYQNGSVNGFDDPENAEEAYNYMQGFTKEGDPWYEFLDESLAPTTFLYSGDPQTRAGWTQFDDQDPRDHRFLMSTGPFNMATWLDDDLDGFPQVGEPGVQEIVSAIIIGAGTTNLNAVGAMKFFDQFAQGAYDAQFVLPSPPPPTVLVSELDEQFILSWYEDADEVESFSELGYNFQGYNVYQGESQNGPWVRVATYDITDGNTIITDLDFDVETGLILEGPVSFGDDGGLQRLIDIRSDATRSNQSLINGRTYYFVVTSFAYNPDKAPKVVESAFEPWTIRPHIPGVGEMLEAETGEIVTMDHVGIAETVVEAEVVDPLQLTGDEYAVEFAYDSTTSTGSWYMGRLENDLITDTLVVSTVLDSFRTDLIDGFALTVKDVAFSAPKFNQGWVQTENITGTTIDSVVYLAISPGGVDSLVWSDGVGSDTIKIDSLYGPGNYWDTPAWFDVINDTYIHLYKEFTHNVHIQSFASDVGGTDHLAASIPGIGGGITEDEDIQSDIELRFTENGQKAWSWGPATGFAPTESQVPFEVWDVERDMQLCVGHVDWNSTGVTHDDSAMTLEGDWVVTLHRDYATYQDSAFEFFGSPYTGWLFIFNTSSLYDIGDELYLSFLNPVKVGEDRYEFSPEALTDDLTDEQTKAQLDEINVFPNPYFGFNVEETQPLDRFVRFTHLPTGECTIRIYSLAGHFVERIDHSESELAGTTFEEWDLTNARGIPVSSGMYIVHIDVPDVGSTFLKLAIFQPEERLDVY